MTLFLMEVQSSCRRALHVLHFSRSWILPTVLDDTQDTQKANTPAYAPRSIFCRKHNFRSFLFFLLWWASFDYCCGVSDKNLANALGGVLSEPDTLGQKQQVPVVFSFSPSWGRFWGSFSSFWAAVKLWWELFLDLFFLFRSRIIRDPYLRTY